MEEKKDVSRPGQITDMIKDVSVRLGKLYDVMGQERVSYELIRGDIEAWKGKLNTIKSEHSQWEQQIKLKQEMADKIIEVAKEEAKKFIDASHERNGISLRLLEEVKAFCSGVDKRRLNEIKEKVLAGDK